MAYLDRWGNYWTDTITAIASVALRYDVAQTALTVAQQKMANRNLTYPNFAAIPAVAAGAQAGGTPPVPVIAAGSTDLRGSVTFGTGSAPAAGSMVAVTFNTAFATVPFVFIQESNGITALLNPHIVATTTGFTFSVATAPAASQGNGTYGFTYSIEQ